MRFHLPIGEHHTGDELKILSRKIDALLLCSYKLNSTLFAFVHSHLLMSKDRGMKSPMNLFMESLQLTTGSTEFEIVSDNARLPAPKEVQQPTELLRRRASIPPTKRAEGRWKSNSTSRDCSVSRHLPTDKFCSSCMQIHNVEDPLSPCRDILLSVPRRSFDAKETNNNDDDNEITLGSPAKNMSFSQRSSPSSSRRRMKSKLLETICLAESISVFDQ